MSIEQLKYNRKKFRMLVLSVFFDLIGMATFVIPVFGEVFDIFWAPMSALLIFVMYRKQYGAVGGVLSFFEEILPGLDVIPSFTLMWMLRYYVLPKEKIPVKITAR